MVPLISRYEVLGTRYHGGGGVLFIIGQRHPASPGPSSPPSSFRIAHLIRYTCRALHPLKSSHIKLTFSPSHRNTLTHTHHPPSIFTILRQHHTTAFPATAWTLSLPKNTLVVTNKNTTPRPLTPHVNLVTNNLNHRPISQRDPRGILTTPGYPPSLVSRIPP